MGFWKKPQRIWWRKLLFQVHLWTGIGLGLYILVISVTGAALVFREEIGAAAEPPPAPVATAGEPMDLDRLRLAAQAAHPSFQVSWFLAREDPRQPVEVWLEREGDERLRMFDPVSGEDLGGKGGITGVLDWLADLHFNLLAGRTGLLVNGVGAGFLCLMALTGAVIWWPGVKIWRRSLVIDPKKKWKRLNWDLHSAVGFWSLAFVLIWGVTGVYFAFPEPFRAAVGAFAPLEQFQAPAPLPPPAPGGEPLPVAVLVAKAEAAVPDRVTTWVGLPHEEESPVASVYRAKSHDHSAPVVRVMLDAYSGEIRQLRDLDDANLSLGDTILRWFGYLHFGNFGGVSVKILWTLLGLAPAALFATGFLMWWNRVLSKRWRALGAAIGGSSAAAPDERTASGAARPAH